MAASSFHLFWQFPSAARGARFVDVSAELNVLVPPSVPALYFWALQVDFVDEREVWGGGHTGLQWNRRYPGNTAVNWGGYAGERYGGAVLRGSQSRLPGFVDDPNTCSYLWEPGRSYRLRVFRSPEVPGAWRAEVTDIAAGESTDIRDLFPWSKARPGFIGRWLARTRGSSHSAKVQEKGAGSGFLARPMVWSEVFAACDDPGVTVEWGGFRALDEEGRLWCPQAVSVNYQAASEGGCPNTNSHLGPRGTIIQMTNTKREVPQGAVLRLEECAESSEGASGRS